MAYDGHMSELLDELRDEARSEAKTWLRWVLGGAIVGGLLVGGGAAYFFGMSAFVYGGLIGAVSGGLGALLFYFNVTTL